MTLLFAATLFLSASLVFLVQPMFARMVLPSLGGSPAVWNTCVVFFQAALLAGYAYAHLTARAIAPARQGAIHLSILAAAAVLLPVAVPGDWAPPTDRTPIPALLQLLASTVGLPFVAVAATAPLLQAWFARTSHPSARDPYFLYAASNLGSIAALLAYPFVIEPRLTLTAQSRAWTAAYAVFALLMVACAGAAIRLAPSRCSRGPDDRSARAADVLTLARRIRWLALAFVPSSSMLGVTTYLTTDVAAVPLLWTIPLALYLLTFVLTFASARPASRPRRGLALNTMAIVVPLLAVTTILGVTRPLWFLVPLHLVTFFACAIVLHGELARDRPPASELTAFYFWISAGGLLGGVFNTLVAPALFTSVVEYPLALVLACLLRPGGPVRPTAGAGGGRRGFAGLGAADIALPIAFGLVAAGFTTALVRSTMPLVVGLAAGGAGAIWAACARRPLRLGLALLALFAAGSFVGPRDGDLLHAERTFFGVHRVTADRDASRHRLYHGSTLHGEQRLDPALRATPTSYYHPDGPIGQVVRGRPDGFDRVAVVGLGAGGLAAYARPGQEWTFYEIDPAVERIARTPRLFTYLDDCGAACRVVLGDARQSFARSAGAAYDLIVLDAFSSDAIPTHLVTRQAVELYFSRLAADGLVALHISNRHLSLRGVLGALARAIGVEARAQSYRPAGGLGGRASEWVVMARSKTALGTLAADERWPALPETSVRVWTDDYSDILSVLRR